MQLLATVGGQNDVEEALANGAEGVGLYRTEFLFLDREAPPTVEEQEEAYRAVFEAFAGPLVRCARSTPAPTSRARS